MGGRERTLYVLTDEALVALSREGKLLKRAPLPARLADIAFDSKQDAVVGITVGGDAALRFKAGELLPYAPIKLGVRMDGELTLQDDPTGEGFVAHADGSPVAWRLLLPASSAPQVSKIALEGTRAPLGLTVGDHGQMLVSDGGKIVELDAQGKPVDGSAFAGQPGGSRLDIRRSFDGSDPATENDRRFRNA
jgi:hypothetical protein